MDRQGTGNFAVTCMRMRAAETSHRAGSDVVSERGSVTLTVLQLMSRARQECKAGIIGVRVFWYVLEEKGKNRISNKNGVGFWSSAASTTTISSRGPLAGAAAGPLNSEWIMAK